MRFLNWVDTPDKDKLFAKIRRHLLIQHKALDARKSSQAPNFNQTKTFFRFSYKRQTVYFGFYLPCQSHTSCVTPCNYITKSQQLCFSHSLIEQSRLSKLQNNSPIKKRPSFKDKLNPTKGELKALRRYEQPFDGPKPTVSRRLGIVFTKALVPGFMKRPPEAIPCHNPLIKYRPWMVQYDTRILPRHVLTVKQLARHKRLGIFNPKDYSDYSDFPTKGITLNIENNHSNDTSGFVTCNKDKSNPYFCLLHKHKHTPLYYSHNWNKPIPTTSAYYMKNSTLPPDLSHHIFNLQTYLDHRPPLPVPKAVSNPDLTLNILTQDQMEQDFLNTLNSTPADVDQINSSTSATWLPFNSITINPDQRPQGLCATDDYGPEPLSFLRPMTG
jgi:hypothetical protein